MSLKKLVEEITQPIVEEMGGIVSADGTIQGDTTKKKVKKNKTNSMSGYKKVNEAPTKIKKTIGVFGGRFQPFHSGHLATYKWLSKQVDEAYITTSNIKKPPRHPMNFKEKVRHMVKVGIPKNRIIEEKTPYVADNLLKKFDPETTAVVYAFGQKDAGRLKAGTKKGGGKTYYQDYKKSKGDIRGFEEHGYFVTAPQFGNISGTKTRDMLGNPNIDDKERIKFFKKTFGYFDKGLYNMMTNKFRKLYEVYRGIFESSQIASVDTDDGPSMFSSLTSYRTRGELEAGKLGWAIAKELIDDDVYNSQDFSFVKDTAYPKGPVGSVSYGPAGVREPGAANELDLVGSELWNKWLDHIDMILSNQEYEYVDDMKKERNSVVDDSPKTLDTIEDEEPEEVDKDRGNEQHDEYEIVKEVLSLVHNNLIIEGEVIPLDEGIKFNNFLKDWAKKSKQPFEKVKKTMTNKNTFSIAKLNDFSVDKIFENAKKGYKRASTLFHHLPDKLAKKINNTKLMKEKDRLLKKADDFLQKHPKTKRIMMLGAGAAVTYMWTQMTFVGEPEYDFDLSGVAGAAAGTATLSDLFGGSQGAKFITLFATGKVMGLSFPYPGKNLAKFAVGITYGAYKLRKKKKEKEKEKEEPETTDSGLPKMVKNPNPKGRKKQIATANAIRWVQQNKGPKAAKKYMSSLKEVLTSNKGRNGKELLLMGGAYGHMSHPFDDKDLTFKDLKKIIELGLGGQLSREDNVTEKTDGQNLMISWKDGKLITARNKGHLKNKGETALGIKDVESKFKGRGDIRNAFVYAVRDLSKAIGALSDKQRTKIFGEGSKWMSLEVMWPASENVINYDLTELIFHGAMEYDDSGKVIGQAKDSARMLKGMIKQVNQHIQKHYKISKPNFVTVPKHQDFGKMKKKYQGRLSKLQSQFALKDNDTLGLYHQRFWEEYIYNAAKQFKYKIPANVLKRLTMRWAFFDKSYSVRDMKATLDNDKFLDWVLTTDKMDHSKMVKDNMKPFEELFFEVGAEIMKNMDGWMAVNPTKSVQSIRKKLKSAISNVRSGGDLKKLNKLQQQLSKLDSIGGLDAIVPSEGLVFKYNGNTYKFTGAFAPINQITGLMTF
jgi:cytidyltransferase-like protein